MPTAGMPKRAAALTLLVPANPAVYPECVAWIAASSPWVRRDPKSTTGLPAAAWTMRDALVAMSDAVVTMLRSIVSTSCASIIGAVTSRSGSSAKTIVPSGTDRTSPVKRKSTSAVRKSSASGVVLRRDWMSCAEKWKFWRKSCACSIPAAM